MCTPLNDFCIYMFVVCMVYHSFHFNYTYFSIFLLYPQMIEAQKARDAEELQKPFGSNIIAFLKTSKPEIVNIFFAFVCVLLAYQIHAMRAGIKKLLAERDEKDAEIDKLRNILANLSEGIVQNDEGLNNNSSVVTFSARLAQKCANVVRDIFEQSETKVGYSWILGKKLASGDSLEFEKLIEKLHPMILSNIQTAVGDAQFTPEELKERRVAALQGEQHGTTLEDPSILDDGSQSVNGGSTRKNDAQMGDLMQVLEEVHNQDLTDGQNIGNSDEDGSTKVRRTRYAI